VTIVSIETATETVGVAVRNASGAEATFTLRGRRRHVETLAPALEHLLTQLDMVPSDLDVVAVDLGPGLFTGLRVGVAAAKGLAQALGIGVVGLSSLDILLRAAAERGHTGLVVAAVDARRGEVFACVRELHAGRAPAEDVADDVIAAGLFSPGELAAALNELGGGRMVGVGDGAQRYAAVLEAVPGVSCLLDALDSPPPLTLLAMAAELVDAGVAPLAPHLVVPHYMRAADATSNFAQVTPT
jgi:tRNA threonylcarbamoyladenosine biosynthesis protein TsaB